MIKKNLPKSIPKDDPCYWCGEPSTSVEHVPPKCIFPETKDTKGIQFRKNLMTVRSCDLHNLKKSSDDEFLMACLASVVGNNSIGYLHTITKVLRAYQRNGSLITKLMKDAKEASITAPNDHNFPVLIGEPDIPRLQKSLEAIARGVYRIEIGERFIGKCKILPGFIYYSNEVESYKILAHLLFDQEKAQWPKRGENLAIFYYQLGPLDQYGFRPLIMTFFETLFIYAAFDTTGVELPFGNG